MLVNIVGYRCIDLDPESAQHRQGTVERPKSFARLDAGQTSPVEAKFEPIHELLLGEPVLFFFNDTATTEIYTGANPIVLRAHIDTHYLLQ